DQLDIECTDVVTEDTIVILGGDPVGDYDGLQYFTALEHLEIWDGDPFYIVLPALPNSLTSFKTWYLTDTLVLPATLPPNLVTLNMQGHMVLGGLPALPNSLEYLNLSSMSGIDSINSMPSNLKKIVVSFTYNLTYLAPFGDSLTYIDLNNSNNIGGLPYIPPGVDTIILNDANSIATINNLSDSLKYFSAMPIYGLTEIPILPDGIEFFRLTESWITYLPAFPASLEYINVLGSWLLNEMPELPDGLLYLYANNCDLMCLPYLPESIFDGAVYGNPLLNCVSIHRNWMLPSSLALPICVPGDSLINPNGCESVPITGHIYRDNDADCNYSIGDNPLGNIPVVLENSAGDIISVTASTYPGSYGFNVDTGTYKIYVDSSKVYLLEKGCMDDYVIDTSLVSQDSSLVNMNFDLICNGDVDLDIHSITEYPPAVIQMVHRLKVIGHDASSWYGLNCAAGVSGEVHVFVDGPISYLGPFPGSEIPTISGTEYTYFISDFGTVNDNSFMLEFSSDSLSATEVADNPICVLAYITTTSSDIDLSNDTLEYCYNVAVAVDPNMKETYPKAVEPGYDDYFTYTVNFQNTGTAPAFNVKLVDTLDAVLDWTTFVVTAYSHDQITTVQNGIMTTTYPNINLPDSSVDYYGSMGYLQYKVKPTTGHPDGTVIENTAHIFFDFNEAIVTNTTLNQYVDYSSVGEHINPTFRIYPNPTTGQFRFRLSQAFQNATIHLFTLEGEEVYSKNIDSANEEFDLSEFSSGLYIVRLTSDDFSVTQRLVISR
ncbi:T9SS type A sorting domain-containing protein, partial [Crocinitomix catalasitica]|nr:T9SS type A sorting domain-containing protein [Crocinitomix catalasitica]